MCLFIAVQVCVLAYFLLTLTSIRVQIKWGGHISAKSGLRRIANNKQLYSSVDRCFRCCYYFFNNNVMFFLFQSHAVKSFVRKFKRVFISFFFTELLAHFSLEFVFTPLLLYSLHIHFFVFVSPHSRVVGVCLRALWPNCEPIISHVMAVEPFSCKMSAMRVNFRFGLCHKTHSRTKMAAIECPAFSWSLWISHSYQPQVPIYVCISIYVRSYVQHSYKKNLNYFLIA